LERLRTAELLPGWYEDWVLVEQERFRALRTAALDSMASYQLSQGNTEETKAASKLAISLEPFRESSYRLLIEAHLATGDLASALKTYRSFSADLRREFGVGPSPSLAKLVAGAVGDSGRQTDADGSQLSQMLPSLRPATAESEAPGVVLGREFATQKL
jgi:DNA-binding SARP family transcriptional activator